MVQIGVQDGIVVGDSNGSLSRVEPNGQSETGLHNRLRGLPFGAYSDAIEPALRHGKDPVVGINAGIYNDDGRGCGEWYLLNQFQESGEIDETYFRGGAIAVEARGCSGARHIYSVVTAPGNTTYVAGGTDGVHKAPKLGPRATIVKFRRSGKRAMRFGSKGVLVLPKRLSRGAMSYTADIEKYVGGKLLALAYLNNRLVMMRLTQSMGKLDSSFSRDGIAFLPGSIPLNCRRCSVATNRVSVSGDQSIFVLAEARSNKSSIVISIRRNGSLRRSFGDNGKISTRALVGAAKGFQPADLVPDGSGGVTLVGNVGFCPWNCVSGQKDHRQAALIRFDQHGHLDRSVGTDGVMVFSGMNRLTTIEPQGDSYIVAGTDYGDYLGDENWTQPYSYMTRISENG